MPLRVRTLLSRAKVPEAEGAKRIMGKQSLLHREGSRNIFNTVLLFSSAWCVRRGNTRNKNRGAVVNRALKKRDLSAKRDSPALQQKYEKRSI